MPAKSAPVWRCHCARNAVRPPHRCGLRTPDRCHRPRRSRSAGSPRPASNASAASCRHVLMSVPPRQNSCSKRSNTAANCTVSRRQPVRRASAGATCRRKTAGSGPRGRRCASIRRISSRTRSRFCMPDDVSANSNTSAGGGFGRSRAIGICTRKYVAASSNDTPRCFGTSDAFPAR
jgi:hypothetical protein